jgi:hypothetical protein
MKKQALARRSADQALTNQAAARTERPKTRTEQAETARQNQVHRESDL